MAFIKKTWRCNAHTLATNVSVFDPAIGVRGINLKVPTKGAGAFVEYDAGTHLLLILYVERAR